MTFGLAVVSVVAAAAVVVLVVVVAVVAAVVVVLPTIRLFDRLNNGSFFFLNRSGGQNIRLYRLILEHATPSVSVCGCVSLA